MAEISNIERVAIDKLIPYINNAKKHSDEQVTKIASSIREFGFVNPVLIDKDFNVIAGHGRIQAAKKLGLSDCPCVFVEGLTDAQRKAYILADNRLGELADWDMELVTSELETLQELDFDIDMTGFELPEEDEPQEVVEDDFSEEVETRCKLGDVWRLGEHRLICGDSTDGEIIDKVLNGNFARMTVTSPPYGVGKDYEEKGIAPWKKTIGGVINAIKGKTLIICWNIGDLFSTGTQFTEPTGAYSIQMMDEAGYGMLYNRIWKKPGANFAGNNPYYTVTTKPAQDYEYLFAFAEKDADRHILHIKQYLFDSAKAANITDGVVKSLGGPGFMCGHWFTNHQWSLIDEKNYLLLQSYCKSKGITAFEREYDELKQDYLRNTIFSHVLSGDEFSSWGLYGVWEFNTVHERLGGHAAAFPIELPSRYIKMHSYDGDLVLDPFGGTGTTMIACEQLNRKCYMVELDPHYCDVIITRWETFTGREAVLLNE